MKKLTHEDFLERVLDKHGDEYTVLGQYVRYHDPIRLRHNRCGHEWDTTAPVDFLKARPNTCPRCAHPSRKKTTEDFRVEVFELTEGEYELAGEYVTNKIKVQIRHTGGCGLVFDVTPNRFLCGDRCPHCCKPNRRKTTAEFAAEVHTLVGSEYTVCGEYVNNKTKIRMRHDSCGHEHEYGPKEFLSNGARCPRCVSQWRNRPPEDFVRGVAELVGLEYTVLGRYSDSKTPVLMRHEPCGYEWRVKPNLFERADGTRCPNCSNHVRFKESKGARKVREYLEENGITFEREVKFEGCLGPRGRPLLMDFWLPSLNTVIEYNGRLHYEMHPTFNIDKKLELTQLRDQMKLQFCQENGIRLIRVPFWEDPKRMLHDVLVGGKDPDALHDAALERFYTDE